MITDKKVQKLAPKPKRYTVRLDESLFLRVMPSGHKSYVLRYYSGGIVRDITLGTWPQLKVLQAVQAAHHKREELKIRPSKGLTFMDGFKLWKNKKRGDLVSYNDEVERINKHLVPYLGKLKLEDITAPIALNVLIKLETKLPTLKRCLMRLNEILELSVCAGLLHQNPCRKLSRVFALHTPINRPFIPASDLHLLFAELNTKKAPEWFRCYVLFAVYSLLRPVECSSVRWDWIKYDILTIPQELMKKRRPHRVPLCPQVLALLEHTKKLRKKRSIYIWPFGRHGTKINKQYLAKWLNNSSFKGKLCHHGLRATGRTWMRDEGVLREVAEDALAHVSGSQYERAYLRGDYLEQRREVMRKWWLYIYGQYCAVCAPIIPL